jgi:putative peptidoglycan lipid II flippase
LASVIVAAVFVFPGPVVKFFASGFSDATLTLAVSPTKASIFGVYSTGLTSVFASYLRLHGNFVVAVGFPMNFIIISSLFISAKTSVYSIAVGSVVATGVQLLFCIPFVRKTGYRHRWILDLTDEHVKSIVLIVLPVLVGIAVNDINALVDRTLASRIAVGAISSLNYANKLVGFVRGLFVASITSVLYPMVSRMAAAGTGQLSLGKAVLDHGLRQAFQVCSLLLFALGALVSSYSDQLRFGSKHPKWTQPENLDALFIGIYEIVDNSKTGIA